MDSIENFVVKCRKFSVGLQTVIIQPGMLIVYLIIISKIIRMTISINRLQVTDHEAKLFQKLKIPPYVVVLHRSMSTTYGGQEAEFGFVAVFRTMNEVGIDVLISVGYKCEIGTAP